MKVGQSFKRDSITTAYDAIIIGSGMGALTTGALLAKEGWKVLLLEKHYVAGGFTHVFKRKEYEWDVGIHYIGEVHRPHTAMRLMFDDITDGQLKWQEMDEVYDTIIIRDKVYEFVKGKENFIQKLCDHFPNEKQAIHDYVDLVYKVARDARLFFGEKSLPPWLSMIASPFMKGKFGKYANKTTLEVLEALTGNKELIGVLTGQYGDYGLPPALSSFAIHSMVVKHYINGAAYPVGGCQRIAETIAPVIEKAGGAIYVNAGVDKIIIENNKAEGVRMEDGSEIKSKVIISNAGFINTFSSMLEEPWKGKYKLPQKLVKTKPSMAHVCLYIGMKCPHSSLGIGNSNLWIYPGYDHDKNVAEYVKDQSAPPPVIYISFPSSKDPEWELRYPGKATIEIIGMAPYAWFQKWEDKKWKKRGEDYEAVKEKFSQQLLEQLYKYVPAVKGKVDYYELSSPLSTRQFTNYQQGEIYGLEHTPERFNMKFLRTHTPIKNLYLTGQDVATAGVGGALIGGVICASAILGKNMVKEMIKRNQPEVEMS